MQPDLPSPHPRSARGAGVNRRDLLKWMSFGAGAAASGTGIFMVGNQMGRASSPLPTALTMPPNTATRDTLPPETTGSSVEMPPDTVAPTTPISSGRPRTLVVIEMSGGNDGMSMLVPYGNSLYYELRPSTAIAADTVIPINDEVGLHPQLARLSKRRFAVVQGVGSNNSDGSHFEMERRWWTGDPDGTGTHDTGAFGRIADGVGDPSAPAVAVSVGNGQHQALLSKVVGTLSMSGPDQAGYLVNADESDTIRRAFQAGLLAMSDGSRDGYAGMARSVMAQSIEFARRLMDLADVDANGDGTPDNGVAYPGGDLGQGLLLASRLIHSNSGVQVIHVPMGANFDTHENHNEQYWNNMTTLDEALDAFLTDLDQRGSADDVLVMTTSEFGRRVPDNGSGGLDHGAASHTMMFGPMATGLFGEHPSLTDLDHDSMRATCTLDQYYATVASGWFGLDGPSLFNGASVIPDIFV